MEKKPDWKKILKDLHLNWIKATAPGFYQASGGETMKIKPYTDQNTNGLTRCIKDFLEHSGHYCIRTGRQGQVRIERVIRGGSQKDMSGKGVQTYGKISYTKNPEAHSFADLHASIFGSFVAIEVKCSATKDGFKGKRGEQQLRNRDCVVSSGGMHFIATDFPTFYEWYIDFEKLKKNAI